MNHGSKLSALLATALLCALAATGLAQNLAQNPPPPPPASPTEVMPSAESIKAQADLIAKEPAPTVGSILAKMRLACDWQMEHLYFPKPARGTAANTTATLFAGNIDWVRGAFFTGVMANYTATGDYRYFMAAKELAQKNNWLCGPRPRHADDRTIAQTYLEIYMLEGKKDPSQIKAIQAKYDAMMASEQPGRIDWWWCDALYMDPPTLARLAAATGEKKYLDYMNKLYWDSTDFLYNKDEHLYFRDKGYFTKTEKNGKKVFWSRGNGWVFGGLCRVLDFMPQDYPDRPKYVALFKEMADAVVKAQGTEGLWHSSLLDPASYPLGETSGSGFFTYGLAWGINHGLLEEAKYRPAVEKGFKALMACVNEEGKMCYVQPIGADPRLIKATDNMEYATGSFILAGSEVLKLMAGTKFAGSAYITVTNPLDLARTSETIEISWTDLSAKVHGLLPSRLVLIENTKELKMEAGKPVVTPVVTQVIYGSAGPESLIFQANFAAKEAKGYSIMSSPEQMLSKLPDHWTDTNPPSKSVPASKTYGRYIPERKDDFAWENDRIAHRMYGQGLQDRSPSNKDFLITSGIDVWVKKVRYSIINSWYDAGHDSYHTDRGEGLDNYNVNGTRGCGGLGIWAGEKLYNSQNYMTWKVLANGPIRTTFELTYAPWDAAGTKVSEVKRISLDAGSNMDHFVSTFTADKPGPAELAIGLTESRGAGTMVKDAEKGIFSYWENPDPKGNGSIACAAIVEPGQVVKFLHQGNSVKTVENLMVVKADLAKPFSYWAGAGWSKSGDFADAAAWEKYLREFAQRLAAPLKVTFAPSSGFVSGSNQKAINVPSRTSGSSTPASGFSN